MPRTIPRFVRHGKRTRQRATSFAAHRKSDDAGHAFSDRLMELLGLLMLGLVLAFVLRIVLLALRGWWQSRGNPPKPKRPYREWED